MNREQPELDVNVIRDEFNALAPDYESNRLSTWYQAHGDEIIGHCPLLQQGDVLDVGCGTGHLLRQYASTDSNIRGVGLDIAPQMVSVAKQKAKNEHLNHLEFIEGNIEDIDLQIFSDYDFKVIFCVNAFHYFSDPQSAMNKLFNLLGEGGSLFILERDKSRSMLTSIWGMLHHYLIKDHVQFHSQGKLISFCSNSGFTAVTVVSSIKRLFWNRKLFTSIVLIKCLKNSIHYD